MLSFCVFSTLLLAALFPVLSYGAPILPRPWPQTRQLVIFLQNSPIIQHKQYLEQHIHHSDSRADHHRYEPGNLPFLYDHGEKQDDDSKAAITRSLSETDTDYWMTVLSQLPEIYSSASPLLAEARINKEAYHQLVQSMTCKLGIIMQIRNSDNNKNLSWYRRLFSWNFVYHKETNNTKRYSFIAGECTSVVPLDNENDEAKTSSQSVLFTVTPQSIAGVRGKGKDYQDGGFNQLGMSLQKRSTKNDAVMQVITSDVMF